MTLRPPFSSLFALFLALAAAGLPVFVLGQAAAPIPEASGPAQAPSAAVPESSRGSEAAPVTSLPAEEAVLEEGENETPDGKSTLPFAIKAPTAKEAMQGRRLLVKAISLLHQKQALKAAALLRGFEPTERLGQVYRALLLAQAYREGRQSMSADSVLNQALKWVGSATWRNELVQNRLQDFENLATSPEQKREFYAQVLASEAKRNVKVDVLYAWLKLEGFNGEIGQHLDRLRSLLTYARGDKRLDSLYALMAAKAPPGRRSWDEEWLLMQVEARLGAFDKAALRSQAMIPLAPSKAEKQKLHWQAASLQFAKRDWKAALDLYQRYLERYGDSPDAYLQIGRTQDKLEQAQRSQLSYDRFLELYPKHPKTSEIHWLRAWERESDGSYDEAIELYYLQLSRFPATRRADWANFRIGLCLFKDSNFAAAADAFSTYRKEKSNGALPAGLLWEAKALERLHQESLADSLRLVLYRNYPLSFYGQMARQALEARNLLPDSLQPWRRFQPSRPERIKTWMQATVPGFKETLDKTYESAYLDVSQLLELRLDTLAILTMHSTPAKVKRNPWYLFVQARRFERHDLHPEAYRLARALVQLIPNEALGTAPREVLRLIWPRPYEGEVLRYALKRKLDPALIYALMRQESGFDRDIRSPAGAVGLMQIMPATAKKLAESDSLRDFHSEDLAEAEVNVRLGTFYVRQLLDDYTGNPFFMLANYNAGPEPTRRWFRAYGARPVEEMVEDISYWETRDYVKKVMGNYWTYKILYNNRLPLKSAPAKP